MAAKKKASKKTPKRTPIPEGRMNRLAMLPRNPKVERKPKVERRRRRAEVAMTPRTHDTLLGFAHMMGKSEEEIISRALELGLEVMRKQAKALSRS